ncbi:MAG: nicotinate-nucleotide--dimethylbenzimidazole phosphoribosyltransferase [Clostridiales bacterium]|nr:nicotinate-nucleotide--dimethylbenzimidazole phosphoribosyltransferase [Clostridiales bacterium]
MTDAELKLFISGVSPAFSEAAAAAVKRQSELAKPPKSLGKLENISIRLAGITGRVKNELSKCLVAVFAADNGVVNEGVAVTPQSVTLAQAVNMTRHKTGMSALAAYFGNEVRVFDVGINAPERPELITRKLRRGTASILRGPAMTREEALYAVSVGVSAAEKAKRDGFDAMGVGEMGIGNTTTSAAVLAALTGADAELVTGRGSGLNDEALKHKINVVREAIRINAPDKGDPVDVIAKVGGLDIAAMTGAYLGCAKYRLPAIADGFISVVAALLAVRLCPAARDFIFLSHASEEPGYKLAEKELGLLPFLLLDMRLGEGSGCPIAFQVMRAACAVMNGMATFNEAAIDDDYLKNLDEVKDFNYKA